MEVAGAQVHDTKLFLETLVNIIVESPEPTTRNKQNLCVLGGKVMSQLPKTPKDAARQLAAAAINKDFKPEALHEYMDIHGNLLFWRIRLKHPDTGEKWIRPMQLKGEEYVLGEPEFSQGKPLYRLYDLVQRPADTVFICEGEWCVDALQKLGILATTSGSADSASKADWSPLASRNIVLWPDNDEAGTHYVITVARILQTLGCIVQLIDINALYLIPKGDVVDWLRVNPNTRREDIFSLATIDCCNLLIADNGNNLDEQGAEDSDKEGSKGQNQASALVAFVEQHTELFHDKNGDVYAQDISSRETRRLDSRQFKDWLVANFYDRTGKSPRDQSVREALSTLAGLARYRGTCHDVHVRVAYMDRSYFLDLCEPGQSRVIEIKPGAWEIKTDSPVRFIRPETLRPLPELDRGGDLSLLWEMINIPIDCQLLVIAWLCECFRPDTPFPILELIGEQGSAKSTTQTMLRRLIDPNSCDLRAAPKAVEDVFISAGVNWLVSYENISHLSAPMQDALCVLATGGGFAKRKLYSDTDESVIVVKCPTILNGISAAVTAQDLIERTLSIEMPIITYRTEITDLWRRYEIEHGKLLGALLDIFVAALARLPNTHLPAADRPRLAEFARLGMAIADAMGKPQSEFLTQFTASRQESIARTIDASPVASAIIEWFEYQGSHTVAKPIKSLFEDIERYKPGNTDSWPRSPKGFADALRRAAPALRQIGIECRSLGKTGSYVCWEIKAREQSVN